MLNPALLDRLEIFVVAGIGLLLAVILGFQVGTGDYFLLALEAAIIFLVVLAAFSGGFFWVLTVASTFLSGTFPILQGQFTPFHILVAAGVVKFLIADVVLRRTKLTMGSRFDAVMIMAFMSILILHGIHDRFGMRFFGSNLWGGKYYVNVILGLAAFVVIQSAPIKQNIWSILPYAVLAVVTFDLSIAIVTTIFPGSIYVIYPFYSAVSQLAIEDVLGVRGLDVSERIRAFGNFGFILTYVILASCSIRQLFSLSGLWRLLAAMAGLAGALYSGFRTSVIYVFLAWLTAGIRDLRWMVLPLLPILVAGLFVLSFINSEVVGLPKQMQRSLAFLPGNWDVEMLNDTVASNEFRFETWGLWWREYFPIHPWFGRGFGFKSEYAKPSAYLNPGNDYRMNVEVGDIHNGLFSALDSFGIIGTLFLFGWNGGLLVRIFRRTESNWNRTALRFVGLCLAVQILSYWGGAPSIGGILPQEFALAAVFLRLQREISLRPASARRKMPAGAPILREAEAVA
jgi:hypothetical protein